MNLLNTEEDADIIDSAVLAVARSLQKDDVEMAFDGIVKTLGHSTDSAKQSATLSLGVLGHAKARPILLGLMRDNGEGRGYLKDTKAVSGIIRGFAAISLGFIGDAEDIPALKEMIDSMPDSEKDLKSCAILALGMYNDPTESADITKYMIDVMARNQMDRMLRSLAPIALSRLDRSTAYTAGLAPLLQKVRSDKTDDDMMRSCVIALGLLANMSDSEVLDALYSVIENHNDQQARHYAYIALGQIAARDGDTESGTKDAAKITANKEAHDKLLAMLLEDAARPKKQTHQPWAALALSIYTRAQKETLPLSVSSAISRLEKSFEETNNPSYKGAMAVALGLLEANATAEMILKELNASNDQALQGYLAVSLGLMKHEAAADRMRAMITEKGIEGKFRLNLARGLGLLNDVKSMETLVNLIAESKTLSETASIAQAIGLIGDRSAIDPLVKLAEGKNEKQLVRAFACVALGLLSEKTPLPWNAVVGVGLNYRSKSDAMSEILDIL
jgi:HEAT repeat protein